MRWILIAMALAVCTGARAWGQDYGGSTGYSLEPWDEDYFYLSNPANRTDLFDPIKYIPLGDEPDDYVTLGGQARYRFDYFNNNDFGAGPRDHGFDLVRLLADADVHLGQYLRAFVQLDSSQDYARAGGPRLGDADNADFQQAFADLNLPLNQDDTAELTVRGGRQELVYGRSDW